MELQLNGLVVKPDEVLIITLPGGTQMLCDQIAQGLREVGLSGRALVIAAADVQLATVPAS